MDSKEEEEVEVVDIAVVLLVAEVVDVAVVLLVVEVVDLLIVLSIVEVLDAVVVVLVLSIKTVKKLNSIAKKLTLLFITKCAYYFYPFILCLFCV